MIRVSAVDLLALAAEYVRKHPNPDMFEDGHPHDAAAAAVVFLDALAAILAAPDQEKE
jgi:hypothetical protein